ncbi:MAG: PAS domain S-box protein, partial [Calditrichia bacterium]|nr:PAS domain S-box protein [Calditrichia bacterium]
IICVNSNSKTKKHHKKETSLVIKDYPEYFKAIRTGEPLAANNARTDPRTKEFTKNYLTPNNIYAMLDVIIKTSGREIGLICVEKNIIYQWENDEKTFIHSVSDQIAQFILSSEQKETLKELNKAQNYINNIINSMPSILIGVDVEGKVTHWNSLAEKTTGISEKNAKGALIEKLLPDYHSMLSRIKQAIEQKSTQKEEKIPISKNDVTNYSDITIYPLIANGVEGVVIRIDDVTESVNIEEMMIQSEKMLSVGGLAAGMAHEINNPLAGMLQNIQVIENRLQKNIPRNISTAEKYDLSFKNMQSYMEERDIWSMIDSVKQSGKRAAKIVDNMLSFSRKSESRYEEQDICQLLDVTVDLASNDYDLKKKYDFRRIKIIRQYEPNLPKVKCESSKIQQVFLNLLKNGAHAIAAQSWQQPEAKKKESCFILKIYVKDKMMNIEIGDNGPGMDESVRKRVFEPFFTT